MAKSITAMMIFILFLAWSLQWAREALMAHGGVVAEEDLCVIEIGVFSAHFTVYQPETRASREFCEDIPDVGAAVFVLDYLHDSLREVPVDFRIIHDLGGHTIYAGWEDIENMQNIEEATVFYQPPATYPNASLSVEHRFAEKGWYTGIVTTRHPLKDQAYQAVFGFHVGRRDWGIWPFMILIIIAIQAHYWVSSGGYRRWRSGRNEDSGQ